MLILVGEAPTKDVLQTWVGRVKVINAYGPSEVSVFIGSHQYTDPDEQPTNIGRAFSGNMWIVEPSDYHKLTPIGCVGEILIQRNMARGYLNDEATTKEAFVRTAGFLPAPEPTDTRRFHLSGDLGRYNIDGTIEYLGRRDTQVKMRGFRIELREIEWNIQDLLEGIEHVAADVVAIDGRETLIAFMNYLDQGKKANTTTDLSMAVLGMDNEMLRAMRNLTSELKTRMPSYMIPTLFVPLGFMPLNNSLKLDRKRLRDFARAMGKEQVSALSLGAEAKIAPTTEAEIRLRNLWVQVIGGDISPNDISKNDSFLEVGGDSITAIRLASLAQQNGFAVTVATIFDKPRLSSMAKTEKSVTSVTPAPPFHPEEVEVFSLISLPEDKAGRKRGSTVRRMAAITAAIQEQCRLDTWDDTEDAYPCTALQEGFMALSQKNPGSYINRHVFKLSAGVDIDRFKAAWEITLEACPNMRTRFAIVNQKTVQAVIQVEPEWEDTSNLDLRRYMDERGSQLTMGYGEPLTRYALVKEGSDYYFIWFMHHATFDAWTNSLMWQTLYAAYSGTALPKIDLFAGFIQYITQMDQESASDYWTRQLEGATLTAFPIPNKQAKSNSSRVHKTIISLPKRSDKSLTMATIVRAAWAILLASYCDSGDVCFGTIVSGRNAPVTGIENMPGPMVTTVPVRVKLDRTKRISKFLREIQAQANENIAYEQYGMQNIIKLSTSAREACDFTSLLAVQPMQTMFSSIKGEDILQAVDATKFDMDDAMSGYFNYPLVLQAHVGDDSIKLVSTYHVEQISEQRIEAMAKHIEHIARQLVSDSNKLMSSVADASPWDLEKALTWNCEEVDIRNYTSECVHVMISARAQGYPTDIALLSSSEAISYTEMDRLTDILAAFLRSHGVKPESRVPMCFEKSIWAIVSMIGL